MKGNGRFSLKRDAFRFARPSARDVHACRRCGLRSRRAPGHLFLSCTATTSDSTSITIRRRILTRETVRRTFLMHNDGEGRFEDRTEAAGLNVDNDRYSFACAWGDSKATERPDLYVANDFGRSNLYRNNGDGTFTSVSTEAGVEDAGAGMSACWFGLRQ